MIIDSIKNHRIYQSLGKDFKLAFAYLTDPALSRSTSGKYPIDGDRIFAIIQEYDTKDIADGKLESHRKFIDIQFLLSGSELIGTALLADRKPVISKPDDDLYFYDGEASMVKMDEGMFAVFFPEDLHMPGIMVGQRKKVKKVVIKIQV